MVETTENRSKSNPKWRDKKTTSIEIGNQKIDGNAATTIEHSMRIDKTIFLIEIMTLKGKKDWKKEK